MALRTDPKTLVMAALLDGPRHGYALTKAIQKSLPEGLRLSGGQVYVALRGLEAKGWIHGEWNAEGTERRVYSLTEEGNVALLGLSAEWHVCADAISRLLPRAPSPSPSLA